MNAKNTDYELLYNPRLVVKDHAQVFERWALESEGARATLDAYLDVPYGPSDAERLDVFRARGQSRGVLMYIHGGYWRALDKKDFSFVAPALTQAGITVAVPNYALCPAVRVEDIVMQIVQACAWLYRNGANFGAPPGRLFVCGHSAGGHLAAMMLCCRWRQFAPDLPERVVSAAISISGLYDLGEIAKVPSINADVRLDQRSALKLSPAFMPPSTDAPLYTAVGEAENEGFHVQHALIARRWKHVVREAIVCPDANHFTVLDELCRPGGAILREIRQIVDTPSRVP